MSDLVREFKVNVHVEPIDGYHMSDYDFECMLYVYTNKGVVFKKGDESVKQTDDDNYRVCVSSEDSAKIGRGTVKLKLTAHIPDGDFPDGYRTELVDGLCTGVTL